MRSVGHALAVTVTVGLLAAPVAATDDARAPDLLPGVNLITEEVEPGVRQRLKRLVDRLREDLTDD